MEAASLPVPSGGRGTSRLRRALRPLAFVSAPAAVLGVLFLGPMLVMLVISLQYGVLSGSSGFTASNFTDALSDPLYREIAFTTLQIATIAMRSSSSSRSRSPTSSRTRSGAGRCRCCSSWSSPTSSTRWCGSTPGGCCSGREGLINEALMRIGLIDVPIDALLFSKFSVIVVLSTSYLTYTVIPIYAAMKAVDRNLFEAALDLGAGWFTTARRVLLPLIAPGIFVALLLVYIPLFTDFASPTLVGGTSGYMLGQVVNDLVLESGESQRRRRAQSVDAGRLGDLRGRRLPAGEDQAARGMSVNGSGPQYDVAIVGGGHNGLAAAHYLAAAGLRTVVLERREIVGGCCVTEEFAPGYRASTGAYVLSMLREPIWNDMKLIERGIHVDPAGPSLNLYADGAALHLDDDISRTQDELRRFSAADARALPGFEDGLAGLAGLVTPLIDRTPPDPARIRARDLGGLASLTALAGRNRKLISDALYLFSTSATQYLSEFFESEQALAALGWHAINDSAAGPSTPGTAYVLLHDHASDAAGGGIRQWGFVRGGIGRVTEAMADSAREAGAEVRTEAPVRKVLVDGGVATGVELESGEQITATRVLSNADPKTTFLRLLDVGELPAEFTAAVRAYRCEGTSVKINLAVDELPIAAAMPRRRRPALPPRNRGGEPDDRGHGRGLRRRRGRDVPPPTPTSSSASRPSTIPRSPRRGSTWSRSTSTRSPTRSPMAPGTTCATTSPTPRSRSSGATSPTSPVRSPRARCWRLPTSSRCSGSGVATRCTATWPSISCSTCAPCAAGPSTGRRSRGSTSAAPGRTRAGA